MKYILTYSEGTEKKYRGAGFTKESEKKEEMIRAYRDFYDSWTELCFSDKGNRYQLEERCDSDNRRLKLTYYCSDDTTYTKILDLLWYDNEEEA